MFYLAVKEHRVVDTFEFLKLFSVNLLTKILIIERV